MFRTIPTEERLPTDRQLMILDFIRSYIAEHATPPTIRQMSERIGTKNPNGVMCHLHALVKKGLLTRTKQGHRMVYMPDPEVIITPKGDHVLMSMTGPVRMKNAAYVSWLREQLQKHSPETTSDLSA